MGLLDDAIRDHLELKRRHGASADEVARQEKEALGPVRREALQAPDAATAAAPVDDDRAPFDDEADLLADDDDEYEPRPRDRVEETTDEEEPVYDEDLLGEDDEPPPPADEPGPRGSGAVRMGDVVPADDEPGGEDVLEETPEFLQETPEHDRLWFEQKPPKDFDF